MPGTTSVVQHSGEDYPVLFGLRAELLSRFAPVVPLVWVSSRMSPYVVSFGVLYGFLGASGFACISIFVSLSGTPSQAGGFSRSRSHRLSARGLRLQAGEGSVPPRRGTRS